MNNSIRKSILSFQLLCDNEILYWEITFDNLLETIQEEFQKLDLEPEVEAEIA